MWIAISAINLALAVMLGAFGAHGLKSFASPEQLVWWGTATQYFFYHALGLLILSVLNKTTPSFPIKIPFILMQIGILFFCGSLYIMALGLPRILGAITPIGGAFMIASWLLIVWQAIKHTK
ncbi:DUF423 domain-containing protein [Acinetobacter haemolyticus]|uniref:DUF423 domain-containing protein n=1 Tax=Acinetobacter haemolyticus TaxID=29430 RepID=UPI002DBF1F15|nr:DUF423 domain-containing protein [Acinetobacter haemolyticus]MEB6675769.1 DUF423 domain-containing protein [Acinetobacter haemolyticus]